MLEVAAQRKTLLVGRRDLRGVAHEQVARFDRPDIRVGLGDVRTDLARGIQGIKQVTPSKVEAMVACRAPTDQVGQERRFSCNLYGVQS